MFSRAFSAIKAKKTVAGIEIGGQSASVAIAQELGDFIWKKKGIPTLHPLNPVDCVKNIADEIKSSGHKIDSIGIASFGPLDISKGAIGSTPKPSWKNFPLLKEFQKHFAGIPIALDTDVNAPAYSEYIALKKTDPSVKSVAYVTIGTGVGLGLFSDNRLYHGKMHPEYGHFFPKRSDGDSFEGSCPYHGDCLEGLISAIAIGKRYNIPPGDVRNININDSIWKYWTDYVAHMASSATLAYSLDVFVIGGGIATANGREYLFDLIREKVDRNLNGYVQPPKIIPPIYGQDAGLVGSCAIALNGEIFNH